MPAMRRIWALADLHLSTDGEKPMHVFDERWRDHDRRMAEAWDARVDPRDLVLLPGDLSWARDLPSARGDLAWIGRRTGDKLLLKGNHDSWWKSRRRVERELPAGCALLQNDAFDAGPCVVVGARGWTDPDDPIAEPGDEVRFSRELERLKLSLADADRRFGREKPRLAMTHYPPWIVGRAPSAVVPVLEAGGARICVYGHLHGEHHALALEGRHRGIEFRLVAADFIDFAPVPIELPAGGGAGR